MSNAHIISVFYDGAVWQDLPNHALQTLQAYVEPSHAPAGNGHDYCTVPGTAETHPSTCWPIFNVRSWGSGW